MPQLFAGRLEPVAQLVEAARRGSANLVTHLRTVFPTIDSVGPARQDNQELAGTSGPAYAGRDQEHTRTPGTTTLSDLAAHTAVWGGTALFAVPSWAPVDIVVDGAPPEPMTRVADSNYWVFVEEIVPGRTHSFSYLVDGQVVASGDVAGYVHESYEAPGVPPGALSEERTVTSHVYPGAVTEYWVYINARADTDRGAPVMVWHDGRGYVGASDLIRHRLQIVSDNLVHRELIPPMVHVLVSPSRPFEELPLRYEGQSQEAAMRSLQYDTVSDRYAQHLLSEVLPDVDKVCNLRQDGYSRGSAGLSSGGISAFLLSWFHPDEFSRAHCGIGSFTGLQWDPDKGAGGGYILPFLVRRDARRNIRVWLSDGMNDIEVDHQGRKDLFVAGSWPLANLQMANALKLSNYDYHFRYGVAGHNAAQSALDLPESLAWLWRDYDPERDHQNFEQEAGEQAEPPYRVEVTNRRHW